MPLSGRSESLLRQRPLRRPSPMWRRTCTAIPSLKTSSSVGSLEAARPDHRGSIVSA